MIPKPSKAHDLVLVEKRRPRPKEYRLKRTSPSIHAVTCERQLGKDRRIQQVNHHLQRIDQRQRTQIRQSHNMIQVAVVIDAMAVILLGTKLIGKGSRGARQVRLGHLREAINGNRQAELNGQNLPNGIHQKEKDLKMPKAKVGPKETKGHTKDRKAARVHLSSAEIVEYDSHSMRREPNTDGCNDVQHGWRGCGLSSCSMIRDL